MTKEEASDPAEFLAFLNDRLTNGILPIVVAGAHAGDARTASILACGAAPMIGASKERQAEFFAALMPGGHPVKNYPVLVEAYVSSLSDSQRQALLDPKKMTVANPIRKLFVAALSCGLESIRAGQREALVRVLKHDSGHRALRYLVSKHAGPSVNALAQGHVELLTMLRPIFDRPPKALLDHIAELSCNATDADVAIEALRVLLGRHWLPTEVVTKNRRLNRFLQERYDRVCVGAPRSRSTHWSNDLKWLEQPSS